MRLRIIAVRGLAAIGLALTAFTSVAQVTFTEIFSKEEQPTTRAFFVRPFGNGSIHALETDLGNGNRHYDLIRMNATGAKAWTLPMAQSPRDLVVVSGIAYVSLGSSIAAIDSAGVTRWTYSAPADTDLSLLRVIGSKVVSVGFRITSAQSDRSGRIVGLNKATGALLFAKDVVAVGRSTPTDRRILASDGTNAYTAFRPSGANGGTIYKLELNGGTTVGSYHSDGYVIANFDVDAQSQVYVSSTGFRFRKLNASGSGDFTQVYEKPIGASPYGILISGANVYLTDTMSPTDASVRKIQKADGETVWHQGIPAAMPALAGAQISDLILDPFGRLLQRFTAQQAFFKDEYLVARDGETGEFLGGRQVESLGLTLEASVDPFGDVLTAGSRNLPNAIVTRYAQPMETRPDTYAFEEGQVYSTNGNGVLANDRYVNPGVCKAILQTPPAQGILTLAANGEFTFDGRGVPAGPLSFTYRVTRGTISVTEQAILLVGRQLTEFSLNRTTLAGQNAALATLRLEPTGPLAAVAISDDSAFVTTPATVSVPGGNLTATFAVKCVPVSASTVVNLTADYGNSHRTALLTLIPLAPSAMAFLPSNNVTGGTTVNARVVLNGVAPTGGVVVSLADDSEFATTPESVTVPAGATQGLFTIETQTPSAMVTARITATLPGGSFGANLRINP